MWEPELRDRVKAVLNPGSRLEIAAADFDNSEQFVTMAHAARNTQVPFVVLKDRVLNRGESLAEAIREFAPAPRRDRIWRSRARAFARRAAVVPPVLVLRCASESILLPRERHEESD